MANYSHLDSILRQQLSPTSVLSVQTQGNGYPNLSQIKPSGLGHQQLSPSEMLKANTSSLNNNLQLPLSLLSDFPSTSTSPNNSDYLSNKSSNRSSFANQQVSQLPFVSSPTFAPSTELWNNQNSFSDESLNNNWNSYAINPIIAPQPQQQQKSTFNDEFINYSYLNKLSTQHELRKPNISPLQSNNQTISQQQRLQQNVFVPQHKAQINKSLFKTELCDSYSKLGYCPYNNKCQFAHGEADLIKVPRSRNFKTKMCKNWLELGYCKYGKRCCYKHGQLDLPPY